MTYKGTYASSWQFMYTFGYSIYFYPMGGPGDTTVKFPEYHRAAIKACERIYKRYNGPSSSFVLE